MNRSGISRLETRSTRANKEELVKRVMLTVERVRKWEKKWVDAGIDGCTLKTYKWVPVAKGESQQVKTVPKDGLSDVSSNTSSPLVLDENNLNSVGAPSKADEGINERQPNLLTNSSSQEIHRHSSIFPESDKNNANMKLGCNGLFSEEGKVVENAGVLHPDISKVLQEDEGEDSNHAPSVTSEDSALLMYHLGMNVGGDNEDSRQSFHSATDSENSADYNRRSPTSSESQHTKAQESAVSFNGAASTFVDASNSSNTERINMSEEPPTKRTRKDSTHQ